MNVRSLFKGASLTLVVAITAVLLLAGCSPKTTGKVRDDVSLTKQTKELKEEGLNYRGPEYTIAIITFENKTPSRTLGVGEAATDILRTIVKKAGLEPIVLSEEELMKHEELIALQRSGVIKTGDKKADEGFVSIDFRISGAVTAFSQVEEEFDILIGKSKSDIVRVQVDYALVDIASGKSLVADSGMGEYKKKVRQLLGIGGKSSGDTGLRDGALRDALTKAMTKMIAKLNEIPFQGRVLLVDSDTVIFRGGTKSRLKVGTRLGVYQTGRALIDPDTGRTIGHVEIKTGEIELTSHQDDVISHGRIISGSDFKVGDAIKELK